MPQWLSAENKDLSLMHSVDAASALNTVSVRGSRRARALGLFAAIFALATGLFVTIAEGPYHNKNKSDPSYAYLFNALDIEQGIPPFLIHHPGTTVQLIGAAVLRAKWWIRSQVSSQPPIVASVLREPEEYLRTINVALLLLMAGMIGVATKRVYELTGQTSLSLMVPSLLLVSASALGATGQFQPELLAVPLGMAVTLLAVPEKEQSSIDLYRRASLFGVALGAGIITKITFVPLILLIFAFPTLLAMLIAGLSTFIAALILLLPTFSKLDASYGWFKALATHQGHYGGGPEGIPPVGQLSSAAIDLVRSEPLILVATLVAAAGLYCVRFRGAANRSWTRFYLATVAVSVAQLLIVAKHPMPRYLLPGLASAAVFIPLAFYHISSRTSFTARVSSKLALSGVAAILLATAVYTDVLRYLSTQAGQREAAEIQTIAAGMDCKLVPYYRASGLDYALMFGEYWGGSTFAKQLAGLYPDHVGYDASAGLFEAFGSTFSDPAPRMGNQRWCLIGDYAQSLFKFPDAEIELKKQVGESVMVVIRPRPRTP